MYTHLLATAAPFSPILSYSTGKMWVFFLIYLQYSKQGQIDRSTTEFKHAAKKDAIFDIVPWPL